jgi:predicted MFS family arabinose efflux permease
MNKQNAAAGTIRSALRYRGFRLLLSGLAVSQAGDWLYNLALVTLVYQRTHSALWAGVTTAARVVPLVAFGPVGGVIAGRFDLRRTMAACDLIRLAMMALLALIAATSLPVVIAPLIAAVATMAATPYLPAVSAIIPRMVDDADLPGANAARSAVTAAGIIIGPAAGGALLLAGPPALAFVLNAVTFGVAALTVLAVPAAVSAPAAAPGPRAGLLREVADGAAVLRAHPLALRLVGADIVCSLIYGTQTVLLLGVARRAGLGLHGYGYLFAAIGAGGLIGAALAGRAARARHPRAVLLAALAAAGLPMPLLAVAHWPALALALVFASGAGAIAVEILTETSLQRSLPASAFGRAYGLALPASIAGIAAGSLIAPPLASALGLTGALVSVGAMTAGYALLLTRRPGRQPAPAAAAVPAPAAVRA